MVQSWAAAGQQCVPRADMAVLCSRAAELGTIQGWAEMGSWAAWEEILMRNSAFNLRSLDGNVVMKKFSSFFPQLQAGKLFLLFF